MVLLSTCTVRVYDMNLLSSLLPYMFYVIHHCWELWKTTFEMFLSVFSFSIWSWALSRCVRSLYFRSMFCYLAAWRLQKKQDPFCILASAAKITWPTGLYPKFLGDKTCQCQDESNCVWSCTQKENAVENLEFNPFSYLWRFLASSRLWECSCPVRRLAGPWMLIIYYFKRCLCVPDM